VTTLNWIIEPQPSSDTYPDTTRFVTGVVTVVEIDYFIDLIMFTFN
jgi:hypothetical protein